MKTLKILLITCCLFLITGCSWLFYDKYQVFDDEFKNTKKTITRFDIYPREKRTEIREAKIVIERELAGNKETVRAYFVVSRASSSFKAENKGFIMAGNSQYEVTFDEVTSEYKSKTETSSSAFATIDSTKVSTASITGSETTLWIDDKFIITLDKEITNQFATTDKVLFRFYFGPIPATFVIKGTNLKFLKRSFQEF